MDEIIIDSDCEVVQLNVSTVTITDSQDEDEDGELKECCVDTTRSPIFEVVFKQQTDFDKLSTNIIESLTNGLKTTANKVHLPYEFCIERDKSIIQVFRNEEKIQENETNENNAVDDDDIDYSEDFKALFSIDTNPSECLEKEKVPSYKRVVQDVLDDESVLNKKKKEDENHCRRPKPAASCFNCGSLEHSLRDCPKPRNHQRINRSKRSFKTLERYHVDIEQRFAYLKPGKISSQLQSALGLRRGELPFFFYRMRTLGYPPGWLEDAKVAHSGIALFDSNGVEVLKSDEDEGEVDAMNHKYDISRIIEFPGFNKDPGGNFYDDYKHHNVQPMNTMQLKSEFIKTLGECNISKGYKRKKLKHLPGTETANGSENENNKSTFVVADMEIEDPEVATTGNVIFTRPLPPPDPPSIDGKPPLPPLPLQSPSPPPTQTPMLNQQSNTEIIKRSLSPSLADLEAEQAKLLQELQSNTSNITDNEDSLIDEVIALENPENSVNDSIPNDSIILDTASNPTTSITKPQQLEVSSVIKESHIGTPILKFSPFEKLPAGENFKVGVSDVINFENLPDSTGKYEQMKVVIKNVRKVITKLHNEDNG